MAPDAAKKKINQSKVQILLSCHNLGKKLIIFSINLFLTYYLIEGD